jgi:thioredoxin reductase (NADPH)
MTTDVVENWPGDVSVEGPALMKRMLGHAEKYGASVIQDSVTSVDFSKSPFTVVTKNGAKLLSKTVIIATGSSPKKLNVPGEKEYWGKGVNVCATCDAPLYGGKEVVVVGGGNSAIAEGYALSKYAKKVTIIQVLEKLTATDPLMDILLAQKNVSVICNKKVLEIKGNKSVTSVILEDQKDKSISEYTAQGVFVAIGLKPNTEAFQGHISIDTYGYIERTKGCNTSVKGIFVAGDVTDYRYRQAITASGQGCSAALECEEFLQHQ